MTYRISMKSFFALVAASAVVACGHPVKPESPAPVTPAVTTTEVEVFGLATGDHMPADLLTPDQRTALDRRISFGFDQSDLSAEAREILAEKAEVLRQVPQLRLRIEGHADERGSDEYNLALSVRRAGAATRYLLSHGIDSSRMESMGYGEERPLDPAETEAAWAMNRRDEFRVSAGPFAQQ